MSDSVSQSRERALDRELVGSNLNRAMSLIGSSMAIFTFLLFFLYPRYRAGQIDPVLFQFTVSLVVFTIFSFGFSGLFYYGMIGVPMMNKERKLALGRRGDLLFVVGVVFAIGQPSVILFTIGLDLLASIALGLWLIFTIFLLVQSKGFLVK